MAKDNKKCRLPFIVGVAGGTASGKSLVTEKIIERLGTSKNSKQVNMISLESFYRDLTPIEQAKAMRGEYDFDHPGAFEFEKLIETINKIKNGHAVDVPIYDFMENTINGSHSIECTDVLIVEGLLIFYDERLRKLFNMKLFVDADADIRLARRVRRDTVERKRALGAVLHQYIHKVKPAFEEFCLPTKKYADVIIPRGGENDVAIDLLVQHIHDILRSPRESPEANGSFHDDGAGDSGRSSRKGNRIVARPH